MKKIILTESEKKAILIAREKAIIESFGEVFNKIKRIDEVSTSLARKAYYGAEKASLDTNQPFDAQRKQNQSDTFRRYINPDIKAMAKKLNIGLERVNTGNAISCYLGQGGELRNSFESADVVVKVKPDEIKIEKGDIRNLPTAYMNSVNRFVKKVQADLTGNSQGQVDENQLNTNKIDQKTTLAFKIIEKITDLLKDDMYVEPDEYGQTTPELIKAFYYNFNDVSDDDTGKLIGWKAGDVKGFTLRVKSYLSNYDIISVNNGIIDVKNSNYPEVAKLLKKLDTLGNSQGQVDENFRSEIGEDDNGISEPKDNPSIIKAKYIQLLDNANEMIGKAHAHSKDDRLINAMNILDTIHSEYWDYGNDERHGY